MGLIGGTTVDIFKPLWRVGWNGFRAIVGMFILTFIVVMSDLPGVLGQISFLATLAIPAFGIFYVLGNYDEVRSDMVGNASQAVVRITQLDDGDTERFRMSYGYGGGSVLPDKKVDMVTVVVGDNLLLLNEECHINMEDLEWSVSDRTSEFYYDQITNVEYNPRLGRVGGMKIGLSGGNSKFIETGRDTGSAVNEIQRRLREYKKRQSR